MELLVLFSPFLPNLIHLLGPPPHYWLLFLSVHLPIRKHPVFSSNQSIHDCRMYNLSLDLLSLATHTKDVPKQVIFWNIFFLFSFSKTLFSLNWYFFDCFLLSSQSWWLFFTSMIVHVHWEAWIGYHRNISKWVTECGAVTNILSCYPMVSLKHIRENLGIFFSAGLA